MNDPNRQSGFDASRVYSVAVHQPDGNPDSPSQIEDAFLQFLNGFRIGGEFVYRDRLRSSLLLHHHSLEVDLRDLGVWNEELGQKVQEQPGEMVPLVSCWITLFVSLFLLLIDSSKAR
jgi:DNA replication licensing factor MCM5